MKLKLFPTSKYSSAVLNSQIFFVRYFYFFCIFLIPFYIIKNNILYPNLLVNEFTIPLYLLFVAGPIVVFNFIEKPAIGCWFVVTVAVLELLVMVTEAGGADAPGFIWLAAIPITYGAAVGFEWGLYSFFSIIIYLVAAQYLSRHGFHIGTIVYKKDEFDIERTISVIGVAAYGLTMSRYYIRHQSAAKLALETSRKETETLLRIVVHDISSPLNSSLLDLNHLMTTEPGSPDDLGTKQRIKRNLTRTSLLLRKIKNLKSVKDGKMQLQIEPIPICSLIQEVVNELRPLAEKKNISMSFESSANNSPVLIDSVILRSIILGNLITNAIKFSWEDSRILIKCELPNNECVRISIVDFGMGIPAEIRDNIWRIDLKTSRTGTSGESGTGYGMPLVKEFIDKMGGSIQIDGNTELGPVSGTKVVFTLPRAN